MSAIEKIEERFEAVRQASFDGQGASIAVWEAEFRAALAEAWVDGAKFILDDQQLCDPNDPFMEAVLDGRNPWRKS
jgi:hypothetical protein